MRRHFIILTIIALVALALNRAPTSVQAQEKPTPIPTLTPTFDVAASLTQIDEVFTTYLTKFSSYQDDYQTAQEKQVQLLWTHTTTPDGEKATLADALNRAPTDQATTGAQMFASLSLSSDMPGRIRIDIYDGPDGKGYVIVEETILKGNIYSRVANYGPEKWRTHDWLLVDPGILR